MAALSGAAVTREHGGSSEPYGSDRVSTPSVGGRHQCEGVNKAQASSLGLGMDGRSLKAGDSEGRLLKGGPASTVHALWRASAWRQQGRLHGHNRADAA